MNGRDLVELRGREGIDPARDLSMLMKNSKEKKVVTGPLGEPMTLEDLPPTDTTRWIMRRKAQIVSAVHGGLITKEEACLIYGLSDEEFIAWQILVEKCGMLGLRATKLKYYRNLIERGIR